MIRLAIGIFIGVLGYHLYLNPGDKDEVMSKAKDYINNGASIVKEFTEK